MYGAPELERNGALMGYGAGVGGGSGLTPSGALVERALVGDDEAAAQLIKRLAAGDPALAEAVGRAGDPNAARIRTLLVHYLAYGTWQGRRLPLPPGFHAGHDTRHLREQVVRSAAMASAWRQTLVDGLRERGDPVFRQACAALLVGSRDPQALEGLVATLSDADEGVRWAAAMALSGAGRPVVEMLLRHLCGEVGPEIRYVAAYVLRSTSDAPLRQLVARVVQALNASDYRVAAPLAANDVLRTLSADQSQAQG